MAVTHKDRLVSSPASRRNATPFLFQTMQEEPDALDRLDIRFRWGRYGIQVLRCHLASFAAGYVIPAHKHRDYEFHFIPAGKGVVTLDEGRFPLHAGVFYLTGPQVVHRQDADAQEAMHELCLHINITPIEEASEKDQWGEHWELAEAEECVRQLNMMPAMPMLDQYNAMNWFLVAYRAWHDRELGAYTTIRQAVIQILIRSTRAYHGSQAYTILPARDMNTYRYRLATQYIRDNYAHPITLEEVAHSLHICGRQLQRILSEHAGETFSGYLERYRLAQVCMALTHTEQTVEQLAVSHGFSSGSYLHYVFKKRLGLTPLQYRALQRQDATCTLPDS
ncbi:AraC family transcriptional regulator [Ktedonosporobacter rubrisoli]|uniref:AraC family transcriptional regulator n=1 Tax=Ktedonosporobacter rubrisoli TaxID=2509675 RepID=A0A4P6JY66_KTERU|nr:AraC family transcriptional regulator [Ktedonosporobacter rubrisoli]QBD80412.1 AraC family transcriptional regulator [Ktedonosporobacter rubrisoli]